MITSSHNPKIQQLRQLLSRPKTRKESGAFVLEGVRLAEEAHTSGFKPIAVVYSEDLSSRGKSLLDSFWLEGVEKTEVLPEILTSLSDTETSQGILVVMPEINLPWPTQPNFLILLDGIRDPGNCGTILRSALAAGVQGVLITAGSTDPFAPKVLRAGMGAQFHLPIRNIAASMLGEFIPSNVNVWTTQAKMGVPHWQADLKQPLCLVIGSEAEGISGEVQLVSTGTLRIPIEPSSESLNAAIAGSILMFEVVRQRSQ